jgi:ribonuclease III
MAESLPKHESFALLEKKLQYHFKQKNLLAIALTHRSFILHRQGEHNERLEFLGDAVLNLVIGSLLMQHFPGRNEGDLSKLRASLVNAQMLARKAGEWSLGQWLLLGRGEDKSGGRQKMSILAAAYEAVLGAVYQDGGITPVSEIVSRHFTPELEEESWALLKDYKTPLQEITQRVFKETPVYTVVQESGPDHAKRFVSQISIAGKLYGHGEGKSKKSAEQVAALQTLDMLKKEQENLQFHERPKIAG